MIKKIITAVAFFLAAVPLKAYNLYDFYEEALEDTKHEMSAGVKTTYFYDWVEKDGDSRNKVGVNTTVFSWRFICVDPAMIYVPKSSTEIASFGFAFPIKLSRIPIGRSRELGDLFGKKYMNENDKSWIDRLYFGPYFAQDLSTGRFGAGVNASFRFF